MIGTGGKRETMADLPPYYFRMRDNGAVVFRVGYDERNQRIQMEPIATVQIRNGEIRPQGERGLSPADRAAIGDWVAVRQAAQAVRGLDDAERCIEALNATAQWAQSRAGGDEVQQVTDRLLMAMHDLRSVLVRKEAERLVPKPKG